MSEEEYSVKTVAQLKIILQEKGLPVSGKKADLITRLVEHESTSKPKSIPTNKSMKSEDGISQDNLPFLSSIIQNGIGSVDFDKEQTIRYGITAFMLTMIIVSLNSVSWYSHTLEYGGIEWGEQKEEYSLGLSEGEGSIFMGNVELGSITFSLDGLTCEQMEYFDCESFSKAGALTSMFLWLSMLSIIGMFSIAIAQGFGKLDSGFFIEHEKIIETGSWLLASIPILIATITYASMVTAPTCDEVVSGCEGNPSSGLGGMWWMMFIFSTGYICYIYRHKIMQLYQKFMSDEPEASND